MPGGQDVDGIVGALEKLPLIDLRAVLKRGGELLVTNSLCQNATL